MRATVFSPFLAALLAAAPALLAASSEPPAPIVRVTLAPDDRTGFSLLSPETTGIRFTNSVAESRSLTNHILLNGSGVAAGDIDGDGLCDLYFCHLDGPNALYRNLGDWRFEEMARQLGVDCPDLDSAGAVLVDLDGDGDLDLLVSSIRRGVSCFLNDGRGRFEDVTARAGLRSITASMSMSLADIDGDGDLDLYVSNYRNETLRDAFQMRLRVRTVEGRQIVTMVNNRALVGPDLEGWVTLDAQGGIMENGQADVLYRNEGGARFVPVPFTGGAFLDEQGQPITDPLYDWTLTGMFRDLNQDGLPDLYVCSDMASPDRIWINRGDGRFQALRSTALRKTSWFSMGVDFADLDRDGHDEIFVTDMVSRDHRLRQVQVSDHQPVFSRVGVFEDRPQTPRNTLFWNRGDGDYLEIAYRSGLHASEWSWSPVFLDVDLDGYEDALITTGFERDVQDIDIANQLEAVRHARRLSDAEALRMRARFPRLALANLAFRNRGDLTFEEVGAAWGFSTVGVSQGVALADLDNDGDLDVVVNNMNMAAGVYRNESTAPRVAVRLRGSPPNTGGIGARVELLGGPVPHQAQEMIAGGRYLSSDHAQRTFAAGPSPRNLRVRVRWRSGRQTSVAVEPNGIYELHESDGSAAPPPHQPDAVMPLFTEVSASFGHRHTDTDFDDFARQPLQPRKLSQLGPGVAWIDLDQDGWDDLVIGSGRGGRLGVYRNNRTGGFEAVDALPYAVPVNRDQTALLGWPKSPSEMVVLVGSASYEDGPGPHASVLQYHPGHPAPGDVLGPYSSSVGPMVLADLDADGDLDLFVGGRVLPGRYPESASSRVFRQENGQWLEDDAATLAFREAGLVSGAVASDWDGDGFPELILACDWGSLQVWHNHQGQRFVNITERLGLHRYRGWWNGVTTGDFDGDGRLDIVASNWGLNSKFTAYDALPTRLYFGDFNQRGEVDLLEAYHESTLNRTVPWMHLGRVGSALPFIRTRFRSYREFGEASVDDILGDRFSAARVLQADWMPTTVFLNRTDHVIAIPLPTEAQLAPAFATVVADIDGNGTEDLFLSQNFFATEPETGRYDGGRGLWLLGDGRGQWSALPAQVSGIRIYGEQRGAAVADFDRDGRVDLVVTQNGADTRLFRNTGARPGLRVRLIGPPGNPQGIGAVIRVGQDGRYGPAREIHAGSGYWSQDSPLAVMAAPTLPAEVQVRWPGGRLSRETVFNGTKEVVVRYPDMESTGPAR